MAKAPAKALTKSEIAATLAEKVGITKKQVNLFFQEQSALAYKQAKNSFVIPGVGSGSAFHSAAPLAGRPRLDAGVTAIGNWARAALPTPLLSTRGRGSMAAPDSCLSIR